MVTANYKTVNELEFGGCRAVSNVVEATIVELSVMDDFGMDIIDSFAEFLEEKGLAEYWENTVEISKVYTIADCIPHVGMKFVFRRLMSGKNMVDSPEMGGGTQWVSDVIALMKEYLLYLLREDFCEHSNVRLLINADGKQVEWK